MRRALAVARDPFEIDGPAVISFSGGRTSARLLRAVLDRGLKKHVHVLFANTGKERPETLDFVHECETRWSVALHWIEYMPGDEARRAQYVEVNYASASRRGEPFDALIKHRERLPNPLMRMCTQELKIRPMREWMKDRGYRHWTMVVGLRADEPRRVARMRALNEQAKERWQTAMPLADAGINEADVLAFWAAQPFDLRLRTWEGNCDLCFLKSQDKRVRIIQDRPDLLPWWITKERTNGQPFRRNARDYDGLLKLAWRLPVIQPIAGAPDDQPDCMCTD